MKRIRSWTRRHPHLTTGFLACAASSATIVGIHKALSSTGFKERGVQPSNACLTVFLQVHEVTNLLLRITCVEVAVTYRKSGTWQHFLDSSKCRCWRERRATRVRYTCSRCSSDHDRLETQNEHHSSNQTLERETLKQVPISCRRFARRLLSSPF